MKKFKVKGRITTEAIYPRGMTINVVIDAESRDEACDVIINDIFKNFIGGELKVEEVK